MGAQNATGLKCKNKMESNLYFLHPEVVTFTETAVNVDNAALKISKQT